MTDSGLNQTMANLQAGNPTQYIVYCDRGYDINTHIQSAYHGPGDLTAHMLRCNDIMNPIRVSEEWGLGVVSQQFPYVKREDLLKLQLVDVETQMRVAILLSNAYSCLHASNVSFYYSCPPPILEEYFSILPN